MTVGANLGWPFNDRKLDRQQRGGQQQNGQRRGGHGQGLHRPKARKTLLRRFAQRLALPGLALTAGLAAPVQAGETGGPGAAARSSAPGPVLEDLMTLDEIYLNLVKEPRLKPYSPKPFIRAEPYALPFGPDTLFVSPKERLKALIPADLVPFFDLYLYINKATRGIWSQQMFVFEKVKTRPPVMDGGPEGDGGAGQAQSIVAADAPAVVPALPDAPAPLTVTLTDRWLVSTGRERRERYFTETPLGLFRLDQDRFYTFVRSYQWNGAAMPYAMFFDWDYATRKTGYAIHAAGRSTHRRLGRRASGGCVRLSLDHARALFKRIRENHVGQVPEFPFDPSVGLTKADGTMVRDEAGAPVLKPGYRVLVVIDDQIEEVDL